MTLDPALVKDAAYFCAIFGCQVYNSLKHQKNAKRISANAATVESGYEKLHKDFEDARSAIERMAITMNGGDRRKPLPTTLSEAEAHAVERSGFGGRWTDPRTPRPDAAT